MPKRAWLSCGCQTTMSPCESRPSTSPISSSIGRLEGVDRRRVRGRDLRLRLRRAKSGGFHAVQIDNHVDPLEAAEVPDARAAAFLRGLVVPAAVGPDVLLGRRQLVAGAGLRGMTRCPGRRNPGTGLLRPLLPPAPSTRNHLPPPPAFFGFFSTRSAQCDCRLRCKNEAPTGCASSDGT